MFSVFGDKLSHILKGRKAPVDAEGSFCVYLCVRPHINMPSPRYPHDAWAGDDGSSQAINRIETMDFMNRKSYFGDRMLEVASCKGSQGGHCGQGSLELWLLGNEAHGCLCSLCPDHSGLSIP